MPSQLAEISDRYAAHVQEIREFLLKEGLPVETPEAIPQMAARLGTDLRFRADVASLVRAVLYREREGIGYEDLLGILVAAAAGTEHEVTGASREADTREMLRFLLQSRRPTFRAEPEESEPAAAVPAEARESMPIRAETVTPAGPQPLAEPRLSESVRSNSVRSDSVANEPVREVREVRRTEERRASEEVASRDPVLPFRRPSRVEPEPELFATQTENAEPWWRVHSSWLVGAVCLLLGAGAGLMVHRGLPGGHTTQLAVATQGSAAPAAASLSSAPHGSSPGKAKPTTAPKHTPGGSPRVGRGSMTGISTPPQPAASVVPAPIERPAVAEEHRSDVPTSADIQARLAVPQPGPEKGAAVPMTVVKQVVRASLSEAPDSAEPTDITPSTAETRTIVQPGSAGIMAANVIYSPPPEYPASASAARVQGQVTVKAVVDPEGKVIYARVVSGPEMLRDAALEAVQRWRYRPLLYYGKPIAVTTTAILDFKFAK